MPAIAYEHFEADDLQLEEAPVAAASAEAPGLPLPLAFPKSRAGLGRRRGAVASAAALLLGCAAGAMVLSTFMRSGNAAPEASSPAVSGAGEQLWGFGGGGGSCAAQGCQCNCAWAAEPNACLPGANDGQCCWSCCCADHGSGGSFNGGNGGYGHHGLVNAGYDHVSNGYDGLAVGNGDMYHGSSYYPRSYAGHHHVVHHFSVITLFWVVLFCGLCVLACVGVYLVMKKDK